MRYEIRLPNGDTAGADSVEAITLAVETLLEDANRFLRTNLIVMKHGEYDPQLTEMLQHDGMVL